MRTIPLRDDVFGRIIDGLEGRKRGGIGYGLRGEFGLFSLTRAPQSTPRREGAPEGFDLSFGGALPLWGWATW